ncbi:hypothetical protein NIES2109_21340 [Nostoc sp. HK-01]|uniref:Type II secretion system protein GspC N-terminal domain-containing protein n=1 Tax=Nostoc cycadae WK-1 TaxID=1861711 RepID=A0A2H6LMB2_9NOSO|nr:hypothetical protein NIES2109_21340 [Nostoc sp. HK-01]GBE94286.1 hypothetical protein NCWK1_4057 [Nostoc cycadae WK-1]
MPMLQEFNTHLIFPEPSEELITNEPWSIDIYADGLMDDLFADIDDILDGSGTLSSHTVRYGGRIPQRSREETSVNDWYYSDYEPLQTLNIPQIVLPNTLNRTVQSVPQVRHQHASTVVVDTPATASGIRRPKKIRLAFRKLVILGTAVGIAIAGTIYLLRAEFLSVLTGKYTQQNILVSGAQLPTRADVEADLADYLLGSLAIIDQQNQTSFRSGISNRITSSPTSVASVSSLPIGNLPSPLTSNNTAPTPNRSASNVVERIYIPVYQAPSPMRYGLPRLPGTPIALPPIANARQTTQPNAVKTALNTVKQPGKPVSVNMLAAAVRTDLKPVAVRTTPITVRQSASPIPSLPVAPLRAAQPSVASLAASPRTTQQVYLASSAQAAPSHTLEGVLELGNKSAALFQVDGVTRRINIGESIGTSGWTLVEVNNGEAIIRRNGEVRSIYTGQKL